MFARPSAVLVLLLAFLSPSVVAQQGAQAPAIDLFDSRDRAVQTVIEASRSDRAEFRAQAIEAAQHIPDRARPMVQLALEDENPAVRFAALYVMGKLEFKGLERAVQPLWNQDQPAYIRAAVVYAADRCGFARDELVSQMASFLEDPDPSVRANAAFLLGEMGNDGAIAMLRQAARQPAGDKHPPIRWQILKIQVAEALAKLGDARGIDAIRAGAYSGYDEVRILSAQIAGRQGDQNFWGNLNNFLIEDPIEFRLAAAESLTRLGRPQGLGVLLEGASYDLATVRAQAAFGLGQSSHALAKQALVQLLDDPAASVRLAAAAAVLEATAP